ncbi:MAG: chromate resistance protein [Proteobacteria bacterium]|nr:chromate resistance protein [Pseudomonadota bacterium]
MKWITRERPKIDRIACPWLIRKFVDPTAEFLYVSKDIVLKAAKEQDAIPYDVPGIELTHDGPYCSFDAIIKKYNIKDPAVLSLAKIVRAADTDTLDNAPEAAGLLAISRGLSANMPDDHDMLKVGMDIYEALYQRPKILTRRGFPKR